MKFYQRLDWQLAIAVVITVLAALAISGSLRKIGVQIFFETTPESQLMQLAAVSDYLNQAPLDPSPTKQQDYARSLLNAIYSHHSIEKVIYMVTPSSFDWVADSTNDNVQIELIREEPNDRGYSVVVSSYYQDNQQFIIYSQVPAVELGNNLLLLAVANPINYSPKDPVMVIARDLNQHLKLYGWIYVFLIFFIVALVRIRLHKLRELESHAQNISIKQLPEPLAPGYFDDEVNHLVKVLNATVARLKEEEHQRNRMLSDIAHELRTPLNNLLGRLEAHQHGIIADTDKVFNYSRKQVDHLIQIVQDVDLLTTIDYKSLPLNKETLKVHGLIEEELKDNTNNGKMSYDIIGDVPDIKADPLRIRQVFKNLIQNTINANPDSVSITVKLLTEKAQIIIAFEDNGNGVDPEHLHLIFERLYRVDSSRNEKTGGAGLGLSIVKHLIELHQGSIEAYIPQHGGLGFCIRLPQ